MVSLTNSVACAVFWFASCLIACSQSAVNSRKPTLEETQAAIAAATGDAQLNLKFDVLKRPDFPPDYREQIASELIAQLEAVPNEQRNIAGLGLAYGGRGTALMNRGDLPSALEMFSRAEALGKQCEAENPNVFFKARCNHAACLTMQGESKEAARLLQEAIVFAAPYGDQLELPFVYTLLAHHAEQAGATDMAFRYLQSAFDTAVRTKKDQLAAQAGVSIVGMLVVNQQNEEAADWIKKVESYVQKDSNPATAITFAMHREDVRSGLGEPQNAAKELQRIATEAESTGNPQTIGNVYMSLAAAHNLAGQHNEAIAAADKAIAALVGIERSFWLAKWHRLHAQFRLKKFDEVLAGTDEMLEKVDQSYPRWRALELRSQTLKELGRIEEAFDTLVEAREEEQKRLSERAREQSNFMATVFEDQKRSSELALAQQRSQAAESRAKLHQAEATMQSQAALVERRLRYAIMIASAIIGLLGIIIFRALSNRRTAQALAKREHQLNLELNDHLARQATELQRAVAERRQLEIAVERKHRDEALGKLTGGVAHDFNNLLTVIVQSIELVKMSATHLDDRTTQLLNSSLKAAESGAGIINQLLAYARQQPLIAKRFNVGAWMETSKAMFHQMAGKRAEFLISSAAANASILADSARLTTAVINLLSNARDAIDPIEGTIHLTVDTLQIDASNSKQWNDAHHGEYVLFEVMDNGKGMTEEQLAHACEPFFSTKTASTGTGLGLSSVVGFVKQSSGEFVLSSEKDRGTTARFILPTLKNSASIASTKVSTSDVPVSAVAASTTAPESVLLVEDQDDVRFVISLSLKSMGLNVIEASSADEATAILAHEPKPKCVLTDIRMPGSMDGIALRRWVMSHCQNVPVVLMSGYNDSDCGLEPDAIFLQKPIKPLELRSALDAI